jgi:GTP pyrophosphokinase
MHRTAESGVAAHYVYKQGGSVDPELDAKLGGFLASTADWQRSASDDEYMDFLRTALYQEEVFVYTPRRELRRLPKGSTPIDFAFQIHTAVGQHTAGARVNGELVPIRYELRNGDTVEIITSVHAHPHEDWLQIARSTGARSKIRQWLRSRRHSDSVALGREMIDRELRRLRLTPGEDVLLEAARAFGCSDLEQLHARLAEGQVSIAQIMHRLAPAKPGFAERLAKQIPDALGLGRKASGGVRIQGIDNVMLSFARCCQPVPGDPVLGIVTVGRGVSVHRQDCPNTFRGVDPDRRVPVEWDTASSEVFPVRLLVYGQDRPSLLADITKAIAAIPVNIRTAGMASEDKTVRGVFVVEVANLQKLNEVLGAIRKVPGVTRVERRQRLLRNRPARPGDSPGRA